MVRKKIKRKSYAASKALGYRGGFSTKLPRKSFSKYASPALEAGWNSLLRSAKQKTTNEAKEFLNRVVRDTTINVGKTKVKMVRNPSLGVVGSPNSKSPSEEMSARNSISGSNHLFSAHKHSWNVTAGQKPSKWLNTQATLGGESKIKFRDTIETYDMENVNRSALSRDFGFNQKLQWFISNTQFGFRADDLDQEFSFSGEYDSSRIADQTTYLGIKSLLSKAKITNMNRYVPVKVKVSLISLLRNYDPDDIMLESANNNPTSQEEGAMPIAFQYSPITNNPTAIGESVLVDIKSPGVKAANSWKDGATTIATKTFKLAAGDNLEVNYNQLCGSGVRLDKLFGYQDSNSYKATKPITFSLLIEAYGEEVELVDVLDTTKVMKGSCIGNIQCEFSKYINGVAPSRSARAVINDGVSLGSNRGWYSKRFATKVISKTTTANFTVKKYNLNHNLVDDVNYSIPVMSDSIKVTAGTNT